MRHLRQWLEARGYELVSHSRPGISQTWVFAGSVLTIEFELDRATDWYLGLTPREGGARSYDLEEFVRCVGGAKGDRIRLPAIDDALRLHLDAFEAACARDRVAATIECLSGRVAAEAG